jgi:tetratricopeptide (TPR) repeat protein
MTIGAAIAAIGCEGDNEATVPQASELYLEAMDAIAAGENGKALESLNSSIEADPAVWSYRERAKLHEKLGNDQAAKKDIEAALGLAPDDVQALWLKGELAKPKDQRFKGTFATPPSPQR